MAEHSTPPANPSFAQARPVTGEAAQVLVANLRAGGARRVLDLGCGEGAFAAMLAEAGFEVVGLDPSPEAIATARARFPALTFHLAGAEALPQGIGRFDACYFVNALHHVPHEHMAKAVLNAVKLVAPAGLVHIIEPLAEGSFFRAMLPVEDETEVRGQAVAVLDALIASGQVELRDLQRWNRHSRFADLQSFVDMLSRVDPARAEAAQSNHAALAKAWRENIRMEEGKALLVQPHVCWSLGTPRREPAQP